MPSGQGKSRPRGRDFAIDAREVEEGIRRNRESNERFLRQYSEWFERHSTKRAKKRQGAWLANRHGAAKARARKQRSRGSS